MIPTFTVATLAFFLIPSLAMARTWHIAAYGPSDAPSVQAGIDSAATGDTVLVGIGTYFETINFKGTNIVVKSAEGPEQTFLNGSGKAGRVVTFDSGENRAAVLEGFSITGGQGGILILDSEPSIVGNWISGNHSLDDGGGIACAGDIDIPPFWFPLIDSNRITDNQAENLGGGIAFFSDVVAEVVNNLISGNETLRGDGGGIYYRNVSVPGAVIMGNRIENNRADDHGGAIYCGPLGTIPLEVEISKNVIWTPIMRKEAPRLLLTAAEGCGCRIPMLGFTTIQLWRILEMVQLTLTAVVW